MAMDVLWIIKDEHEKLRAMINDWKKTSELNLLAKKIHQIKDECLKILALENMYLIPELEGLFPSSSKMAMDTQKTHDCLKKQASGLDKYSVKSKPDLKFRPVADEFCGTAADYLDFVDRDLLPKFREFMPTELREDLGQVFIDARQDALLEA